MLGSCDSVTDRQTDSGGAINNNTRAKLDTCTETKRQRRGAIRARGKARMSDLELETKRE